MIILDFSEGSCDSPAEWTGTEWGFNTDDCGLNGGSFWTVADCTGNRKYAPLPITQVTPGNVVADHTALITGATRPVVSEQVLITLRASTAVTQEAYTCTASPMFLVVPEY